MASFSFEDLEIEGHVISATVKGKEAHKLGPKVIEHLKKLDNQQKLGESYEG